MDALRNATRHYAQQTPLLPGFRRPALVQFLLGHVFLRLPVEVWQLIFANLDLDDIARFSTADRVASCLAEPYRWFALDVTPNLYRFLCEWEEAARRLAPSDVD
ncbi:hypothetical protein HDZ31DRAFT_70406, partial [Schizophyllum fasciatum]